MLVSSELGLIYKTCITVNKSFLDGFQIGQQIPSDLKFFQ